MILNEMSNCKLCNLCKNRTTIVFGSGNVNAKVVFIGGFPEYDDDRAGVPFAGSTGELFTKILSAMGLTREEVYLCNILKCTSATDVEITSVEINSCFPFLKRQLQVLKPNIICTLGPLAVRCMLEINNELDNLRGRFYDYNGMMLMPTYHPSFILKNPAYKRQVWDDMQMIMNRL